VTRATAAAPAARRRAKSRAEKQAETRAALLRSAAKLFSRHGLDGASVEDVARDAGYTKGAFYSNFASKEELFLVMLDDRFTAATERVGRNLAGTGEPDDEAHDAAEGFVRRVHDDPEWFRLYLEFVAYAARNEDFRRQLATRHRELRARLADVYRRWSAGFPAAPPIPIEDIAAMTDLMGNGFIFDKLVDPELDDDLYATMLAIFFRGLQAVALGWEPADDLADAAGR
jgi:AcrR family transcriptional regulator